MGSHIAQAGLDLAMLPFASVLGFQMLGFQNASMAFLIHN